MTIRERLAKMLTEKLGFEVKASELYPATGHWRTNHYSDCLRWEGNHDIGSWSTMTDCVRKGFTISEGRHINSSGMRYEVTAHE